MRLKLTFALAFIAAVTFAQNKTIELWPGTVPGETEAKHPAELRDTLNYVRRITNITNPILTIYSPDVKTNNHAAIIVSPGGGNKYLAIDIEGDEIARWLSHLGYTAFVLQYRVPNKQKGAEQDIQRAVRVVRSDAKRYNLDAGKIGVMGFSAGGNLSARATTQYDEKLYDVTDNIDKTSARPDFALLIYPGSLMVSGAHNLIPELHVTTQLPSVFIFAASDDPYKAPFALANALEEAKIPMEFHIVPKGGHGYGLRKGNPAAEAWPVLAERWLTKTVLQK